MDIEFLYDDDDKKSDEEEAVERLRLGEFLMKYNLIDQSMVPEILEKQKEAGLRFGETILEMGLLTEDQINWALADHLGIPYVDLTMEMVDLDIVKMFPIEMLKHYSFIPFVKFEDEITIAITDPTNTRAISDIKTITGCKVKVAVALRAKIREILDQIASSGLDTVDFDQIASEARPEPDEKVEKGKEKPKEAPGLAFIHFHLLEALRRRATEVHIEPTKYELRIRYRIYGVLHDVKSEPMSIHYAVVNRIKMMANLSVSEIRPQTAYLKSKIGGQDLTVSVSSVPGIWGESVVLRILQPIAPKELGQLNLPPRALNTIQRSLAFLSGLVIVTGSAREARHRLFYTLLNAVRAADKRVISIENPVRRKFDFATQINLVDCPSFSALDVLEMIHTQSPDVIGIEQLDAEGGALASLLNESSLNSRLIIGGLPYSNIYDAFEYLIQNLPSTFPLAANLRVIVSQSVFPKLCDETKEAYAPPQWFLEEAGLGVDEATFYRPAVSKDRKTSPYCGELELFELLPMSTRLKDILFSKSDKPRVREFIESACRPGVREKALKKVLDGELFLEDVLIRMA
ncbi:MAG: Flp pilus assembly complex ATPase component [Desulfobacterales bacterium]|nr:Flp pilus assembly complex ATPase component [Desulfobacterales bacterium]